MKTWKSKLFGDTRSNFYGWIIAGTAMITVSLLWVIQALVAGAQSAECRLLLAIYVILLGQFLLGLTKYLARVARKLEPPSTL
jgi:uncharacterized membrane protein